MGAKGPGNSFERYIEGKWKDALNIAAAEPSSWETSSGRPERGQVERTSLEKPTAERTTGAGKKAVKTTGAASCDIWPGLQRKKVQVPKIQGLHGGPHRSCLQGFRDLDAETKRKALEESELFTFCLRHAAGLECYGREMDSKPACQVPECEGQHTERLHEMISGLNASVNMLVYEQEEEEEYVNMTRGEHCRESVERWETLNDSWLEMEALEEEDKDGVFYINALVREDENERQDEEKEEQDEEELMQGFACQERVSSTEEEGEGCEVGKSKLKRRQNQRR